MKGILYEMIIYEEMETNNQEYPIVKNIPANGAYHNDLR